MVLWGPHQQKVCKLLAKTRIIYTWPYSQSLEGGGDGTHTISLSKTWSRPRVLLIGEVKGSRLLVPLTHLHVCLAGMTYAVINGESLSQSSFTACVELADLSRADIRTPRHTRSSIFSTHLLTDAVGIFNMLDMPGSATFTDIHVLAPCSLSTRLASIGL